MSFPTYLLNLKYFKCSKMRKKLELRKIDLEIRILVYLKGNVSSKNTLTHIHYQRICMNFTKIY